MRGRKPGSDPVYVWSLVLVAWCALWVLALVTLGVYALVRLVAS